MTVEQKSWDDTETKPRDWELDPTVRNDWEDPTDVIDAIETYMATRATRKAMEEQRNQCIAARCKLIGFRGCVLEGSLPDPAKLMLARPCSQAVSRQPARQRSNS